ncbi:MAG: sugar ABC transporter substrate-binding protein [Actinobacteria bacterium]|nr:sugar ABC transporter substrate-binding protein [Actinomycetota bacterium]
MKRLKTSSVLLAALCLALAAVIAGCGSSGSSTSSGSGSGGEGGEGSGEEVKAALLLNIYTDFTQAGREGVEAVIKKAGGSVTPSNAEFEPQKQLAQCQDAITSQRYNVIILGPADSPSSVPCATQAGEAGLPVIAFENPVGPSRTKVEPQVPQVQGSVVIAPMVDAETTFELVEEACKGLPKCVWIDEIGSRSSSLDETKIQYFEEQLKSNPKIELAQLLEGNYLPSETVQKLPNALAANPGVNVITFESDTNAVAAVPALKSAGLEGKVKLIGDGGSVAGAAAIKAGTMFGSVASFPRSMGEKAAEMALQALAKEKISPNGIDMFSLGEPVKLTKANIAEYTPQFGAKE